jgi:peptidyl-prolyl cis-trans isomerase A (cyclophilin A)
MRFLPTVLACLALINLPAMAQTALPHVALETDAGTITIRLEAEKAPATVANFLRYVDQKRLDGTSFYRAMLIGDPGNFGLIQGGVKGDPKRILPPVKHEPTSQTGLSNTNGVIALARAAPGSATADFFIILGDLSSLDAKAEGQGDIAGFAAFGQVVEGMDVVTIIQSAPTSPTLGEGAMKGQMIAKPVIIKAAKRIAYTPPAAKPEFDPSELPQP